jgi:hypothetical protein
MKFPQSYHFKFHSTEKCSKIFYWAKRISNPIEDEGDSLCLASLEKSQTGNSKIRQHKEFNPIMPNRSTE